MTAAAVPELNEPDVINRLLCDHIRQAAANSPRNQQREIGPSGVGVTCDRRLAYSILQWPETNTDTDPLASIVGTAVHAWLADVFSNIPGFIVEQRVTVRQGLHGNADLFYQPLGAVLDWKVVGATAMRRYRTEGPSHQYKVQTQLYGRGFANLGYPVRKVGCVFISRSGRLTDTHVWLDDYRPDVVDTALARKDTILLLASELDVENNPDRWSLIPTSDSHCTYCPYFQPGSTDLSRGCPGHPGRDVRPAQFAGLIGQHTAKEHQS